MTFDLFSKSQQKIEIWLGQILIVAQILPCNDIWMFWHAVVLSPMCLSKSYTFTVGHIDLAQGHQRSSLLRSLRKDYMRYCDPWVPCFLLFFSSAGPLYIAHSWFCPLESGWRGALVFRFWSSWHIAGSAKFRPTILLEWFQLWKKWKKCII